MTLYVLKISHNVYLLGLAPSPNALLKFEVIKTIRNIICPRIELVNKTPSRF